MTLYRRGGITRQAAGPADEARLKRLGYQLVEEVAPQAVPADVPPEQAVEEAPPVPDTEAKKAVKK